MRDVIDIHTHIVPEQFPPYAGRGRDVPWPSMIDAHACHRHVVIKGEIYRTVSDACWSAARRIEDMGRLRVARQAISPMPELLSYWLPVEDGVAMCRFLNDQIAEIVASTPDRFVGLGAVPLQDVDAALRELEYIRERLQLAGVEIASHVNGVSIGDPRFEPFFDAAEHLNAAIFVHPLHPAGRERVVGPFTEQAVCFPGDIALAAASMITSGMALRHPQLRIAFSHGAGAFAMLMPRLVHAWNGTPRLKESLPESPAATARRFYYDELVFSAAAMGFLVASFGSSQIVVGSDYPFALGDPDPVSSLEQAGFESAVLAAIASTNAKRFLGIS